MLWSKEVALEVVNFYSNHVHVRVYGKELKTGLFITGFYGWPNISRRAKSWNLLTAINQGIDKPWCVIGDLNEIAIQDKKLGGRLRPLKQMIEFKKALEINGLLDLGLKE